MQDPWSVCRWRGLALYNMQDEGLDALSRAPGLCVDSEDGGVYRVS